MKQKIRDILATPWAYFAATYLWSWSIWGLVLIIGESMETPRGFGLLFLGVLAPLVIDVLLTYLVRDKDYRSNYWKRIFSFRRIPVKWYLVIFLFAPVLNILAALLDVVMGGSGATWGEAVHNAQINPLLIIPSIFFASVIPFIEEIGWRGYVLDRLQEKYTALKASLIIGVIWSLWHLPLFFVQGTYQAGLGVNSLEFWLFIIGVIPLTLPFTWIYNNTNRSILSVILFHAMVNFTGEVIALNQRADTISIALWLVAAIGITILYGARTLVKKPAIAAEQVEAVAA